MPPNKSIEYNWINGVERLEMYEPGGYHPVMIDDLLRDRYRIVDKLGFGGYSTIWLAHDHRLKQYVAIKVGISSPPLPRREPSILRALSGSMSTSDACNAIPSVLDEFDTQGPNGTHTCYTLALAQGNLKEASFSRLFPIAVARALAAKLTIAVAFVHSQGFVHGDVRLRNVLVKLPSTFDELSIDQFREKYGEPETVPISRADGKPVLSDFGEAFNPATEQRLGKNCNTPAANKAPEALFEPDAPLSYPSDIWSLGTAIWEILGMKFIFSESETDDEIVAQQIDVLGSQHFPPSWRKLWEQPRAEQVEVDEEIPRRPTGDRETWPPLDKAFQEFVQKYRRKREALGIFGDEETRAILDLMRGMLKFRPEERLKMDEVLKSEWMVKWALPELE